MDSEYANFLKIRHKALAGVAQLAEALSCTPEGEGFDSLSGGCGLDPQLG